MKKYIEKNLGDGIQTYDFPGPVSPPRFFSLDCYICFESEICTLQYLSTTVQRSNFYYKSYKFITSYIQGNINNWQHETRGTHFLDTVFRNASQTVILAWLIERVWNIQICVTSFLNTVGIQNLTLQIWKHSKSGLFKDQISNGLVVDGSDYSYVMTIYAIVPWLVNNK